MLYTRILENDFIAEDTREENLRKITAISETEKEAEEIIEKELVAKKSEELITKRTWLIIFMGLSSALLGVTIVGFPEIVNLDSSFGDTFYLYIIGSVIAIFISLIFIKIKESQETSDETPKSDSPLDFEREIEKLFIKSKVSINLPIGSDKGYDFIFQGRVKKIIIEVKAWRQRPPNSYIKIVIHQLQQMIDQTEADEALLVTKEPIKISEETLKDKRIKIMSIAELKNLLKEDKSFFT